MHWEEPAVGALNFLDLSPMCSAKDLSPSLFQGPRAVALLVLPFFQGRVARGPRFEFVLADISSELINPQSFAQSWQQALSETAASWFLPGAWQNRDTRTWVETSAFSVLTASVEVGCETEKDWGRSHAGRSSSLLGLSLVNQDLLFLEVFLALSHCS